MLPLDDVLTSVFNVMVLPLKRLYVLLFSTQVGSTSIGALIMVGVFVAIVIEILLHARPHIPSIYDSNGNKKSK